MLPVFNFILNNKLVSESLNPAITVLDYLRNQKKLTGTKEGCREGDCGACTVLLGSFVKNKIVYKSVNSCLLPLDEIRGRHLVTIEGINSNRLNSIQEAMAIEGGTQCGFCTPGFIISLTSYFLNNTDYDLQSAIKYLDGNICRCTGYAGIKRAINSVIINMPSNSSKNHLEHLIKAKIIPAYFLDIPKQLRVIEKSNVSERKNKKFKPEFVISGGTDLYVKKWEKISESETLFISNKKDFKDIIKNKSVIEVGSSVTIEEFAESKIIQKHFPQIRESLKYFGSLPIRNRATIGGNIVNASPIADISNILLALNAGVILQKGKKERKQLLKNIFIGYKKLDIKTYELIKYISIPIPSGTYYFSYEKVSRREYLDIASVNSSMLIQTKNNIITSMFLSAGGVAPIPKYLESTCSFLTGKDISVKNILEAFELTKGEISPIGDARGSAEYKTILLRQLIIAHFYKLFPQLIDEGAIV